MACKVPFFILFLRKEKSGKEVSEKQLEMEKRKSKTANSNLQNSALSFDAFIVITYLPEVSKLKIRSQNM